MPIASFRDLNNKTVIIIVKPNSLKHLVRTTLAESHNENSKYQKGAITCQHINYTAIGQILTQCNNHLSSADG